MQLPPLEPLRIDAPSGDALGGIWQHLQDLVERDAVRSEALAENRSLLLEILQMLQAAGDKPLSERR